MGGIAPERLLFLDEGGGPTTLVPLRRRPRAGAAAPFGHRTRVTVPGALGQGGVIAAPGGEAATSAAVVHAHLDEGRRPELRRSRPAAVLVLDNLPAHQAPGGRAPLDASGFAYRDLPPHSPDPNPIEPIRAEVKAGLRRLAARTAETLHPALGPALDAVTPQDAAGCFRHCGHGRPS